MGFTPMGARPRPRRYNPALPPFGIARGSRPCRWWHIDYLLRILGIRDRAVPRLMGDMFPEMASYGEMPFFHLVMG